MKNRWSDRDARAFVRGYARDGLSADMALRIYSARLLGEEPSLVLHGGGNVSLKAMAKDVTGEKAEVLYVKGSGHDLGVIGPEGFAPVRRAPLLNLKRRGALSDKEMAGLQRCFLMDANAPSPSVEFLSHAFLPHKFVDHTHSDAVLALTNQPDGAAIAGDVFGRRAAIVPYVMPGLGLAKRALRVYEADPSVKALILVRHGLFTFGWSAEESYKCMIRMVSLAEKRLRQGRKKVFPSARLPKKISSVAEAAPVLRGLLAEQGKRMVLDFRAGPRILAYVNGSMLSRYARAGVATPDHTIRIKPWPLIAPVPRAGKADDFRKDAAKSLALYIGRYRARYERYCTGQAADPLPRVGLVPGLGLFGMGEDAKAAKIAADMAEATISVTAAAEAIGTYRGAREREMFSFEQWGPERAKLDGRPGRDLTGHIVAVTGGAGAIGRAVAGAFAQEGAEVALLDIDGKAAQKAAGAISPYALGLECDVTQLGSVERAFENVVEVFGGLDIAVSNAGAAWQGPIAEMDDEMLRRSFDLNFFGHQAVAQNAAAIMRRQGAGGCLLFNVSKQAVNQGADFGAYGLPKAAVMFLVRQYALELGGEGIRTGGVNADRVRSGLLTGAMIASRSKARGLSEADYMAGNLLR
ncbi:MAG: bifunctional aldolase/short-chain dehydrogenase, partial [Rhodospirillales bacterium]